MWQFYLYVFITTFVLVTLVRGFSEQKKSSSTVDAGKVSHVIIGFIVTAAIFYLQYSILSACWSPLAYMLLGVALHGVMCVIFPLVIKDYSTRRTTASNLIINFIELFGYIYLYYSFFVA